MRVYVTTCPRKKPTLARTLESLRQAGFSNRNLYLREDSPHLGCFGRWMATLREGVGLGEQFAIAQDDILVSRGLARLFHHQVHGVVSCYRSEKPGWGACFYVFSPEAAATLSQQEWHSDKDIDQFVYQSCERLGITFWQPEQSYVYHIGETSTLGDDLKCAGWRQAVGFMEEV